MSASLAEQIATTKATCLGQRVALKFAQRDKLREFLQARAKDNSDKTDLIKLAKEATKALGFQVTKGNIRSVMEACGIEINRRRPRPPAERAAKVEDQIAAAVAASEERTRNTLVLQAGNCATAVAGVADQVRGAVAQNDKLARMVSVLARAVNRLYQGLGEEPSSEMRDLVRSANTPGALFVDARTGRLDVNDRLPDSGGNGHSAFSKE